eukprot:71556-Chlamydomonas_euryale.AAC.1
MGTANTAPLNCRTSRTTLAHARPHACLQDDQPSSSGAPSDAPLAAKPGGGARVAKLSASKFGSRAVTQLEKTLGKAAIEIVLISSPQRNNFPPPTQQISPNGTSLLRSSPPRPQPLPYRPSSTPPFRNLLSLPLCPSPLPPRPLLPPPLCYHYY